MPGGLLTVPASICRRPRGLKVQPPSALNSGAPFQETCVSDAPAARVSSALTVAWGRVGLGCRFVELCLQRLHPRGHLRHLLAHQREFLRDRAGLLRLSGEDPADGDR